VKKKTVLVVFVYRKWIIANRIDSGAQSLGFPDKKPPIMEALVCANTLCAAKLQEFFTSYA